MNLTTIDINYFEFSTHQKIEKKNIFLKIWVDPKNLKIILYYKINF
jgi:hypothetical protein